MKKRRVVLSSNMYMCLLMYTCFSVSPSLYIFLRRMQVYLLRSMHLSFNRSICVGRVCLLKPLSMAQKQNRRSQPSDLNADEMSNIWSLRTPEEARVRVRKFGHLFMFKPTRPKGILGRAAMEF